MSDWNNFKTVNSERDKPDSRVSLISAWIFSGVLGAIGGGGLGWYIAVRMAASTHRRTSFSTTPEMSYESMSAIAGGGVVLGLIAGVIIGLVLFGPGIFGKNQEET